MSPNKLVPKSSTLMQSTVLTPHRVTHEAATVQDSFFAGGATGLLLLPFAGPPVRVRCPLLLQPFRPAGVSGLHSPDRLPSLLRILTDALSDPRPAAQILAVGKIESDESTKQAVVEPLGSLASEAQVSV
eukprot:TRINITY_DN47855_c0_g1_i1.p3 TRINITY_DN47855_c0_g1~~TRINITY_DN47855_c0_g1_i1.p3  ORF type:complete len:130 (-),score=8.14 TRINITY_DN47855_c0_g1_i1:110-499(-)